jgi:2-amino-4-hydroxy-6-hydroxymethyldihydropteridine diphosphokinase
MHEVYLLAGGNIANSRAKYEQLFALLTQRIGTIAALSPFYESPPWGFESPNRFINIAINIHTTLLPDALLEQTQTIERHFGRKKTENPSYEDRSMDIDILFYDTLIVSRDDLQIPHPKIQLRNFVLTPLSMICPTFVHPVLKKDIAQLHAECPDKVAVRQATWL